MVPDAIADRNSTKAIGYCKPSLSSRSIELQEPRSMSQILDSSHEVGLRVAKLRTPIAQLV
jgi:hypothetical protein